MHLFSTIFLFLSMTVMPSNGFLGKHVPSARIHLRKFQIFNRMNDEFGEFRLPFPMGGWNKIRPKIPVSTLESNQKINVYELPTVNKQDTDCLLFYSGGSSIIGHEFYSNFLSTLAKNNISIYTIPFKYDGFDDLVKQLKGEYKSVIPMSHSSGSIPLISSIQNNKNIKQIILLDPIDVRLFRSQKTRLNHLNKILILRAEKSYQGKFVPFIPDFFDLSPEKIRTNAKCQITVVDSEEFGHCDILNPTYSNMIHDNLGVICDSNEDRDNENMYKYMDWLANQIKQFITTEDGCESDDICSL